MEIFDEIQKSWSLGKEQSRESLALNEDSVKRMIVPRVKRERNRVFAYFWSAYFWQLAVYASFTHLVFRFWGDWETVLISLTGIILYLPFTTVLIRKYSRMAQQDNHFAAESMYDNVQKQYVLLREFFHFKRRFDWVGIPVTCLILAATVFKLWVPGGWIENQTGAIVVFVCALMAFGVAAIFENKKSFTRPMEALQMVMKDMKQGSQ